MIAASEIFSMEMSKTEALTQVGVDWGMPAAGVGDACGRQVLLPSSAGGSQGKGCAGGRDLALIPVCGRLGPAYRAVDRLQAFRQASGIDVKEETALTGAASAVNLRSERPCHRPSANCRPSARPSA